MFPLWPIEAILWLKKVRLGRTALLSYQVTTLLQTRRGNKAKLISGAIGGISMKSTLSVALAAACALFLGATVAVNASPFVVTMQEETGTASCGSTGPCIVATGSGQIDMSGLNLLLTSNAVMNFTPQHAAILTGNFGGFVHWYSSSAIQSPTSFGSGPTTYADSGAGDIIGVDGMEVLLPIGYVSDTALSSTAVWNDATFASLGLTGTYTWTWGSGADQNFTLEIGQTPLPAALPLFATGLAGLGLLGWRRKRKAQGGGHRLATVELLGRAT
jgi:hypothetical protein